MTLSQHIRNHVIANYLYPARVKGESTVRFTAAEIHSAMEMDNSFPHVCSAINCGIFKEQSFATKIHHSTPCPSSTVWWEITI